MKIFDIDQDKHWGSKVNFVDENNTVVGYDMDQSCCEHAGWYISREYRTDTDDTYTTTDDLSSHVFDREFFEEVDKADVENGGMVRFKLVSPGKLSYYLHIFNSHNGYYGHGFEVTHSGTVVRTDVL